MSTIAAKGARVDGFESIALCRWRRDVDGYEQMAT